MNQAEADLLRHFAKYPPKNRLDLYSSSALSSLKNQAWQADETPRYIEVPMEDEQPTRHSELLALFDKFDEMVGNGVAEAKAQGKEFALVVGENHYNRNSYTIELMLLAIAKHHGVSILGEETEFERISNWRINLEIESNVSPLDYERYGPEKVLAEAILAGKRDEVPEYQIFTNVALFHLSKDNNHYQKLPLDLGYDEAMAKHAKFSPGYTQIREDAIIETIEAIGKSLIVHIGAFHLSPIISALEETGKYIVLGLDVAQSELPIFNAAMEAKGGTVDQARMMERLNNPNIHQIPFPGQGAWLAIHGAEMVEAIVAERYPDKPVVGKHTEAAAAEDQSAKLTR